MFPLIAWSMSVSLGSPAARRIDRGGSFVVEINKQETECGVMRRGFDRPGVKAKMGQLVGVGLATQNRRRVVQLNPFVHVPVVDWLRRRELT